MEAAEVKEREYQYHNDPAHGWIETTRAELVRLGIAGKVTHYSYQDGERVYLEEDCDAALLLEAITRIDNLTWKLTDRYEDGDSFIRRLQPYTA